MDSYPSATQRSLHEHDFLKSPSPWRFVKFVSAVVYILIQKLIVLIFKPVRLLYNTQSHPHIALRDLLKLAQMSSLLDA